MDFTHVPPTGYTVKMEKQGYEDEPAEQFQLAATS